MDRHEDFHVRERAEWKEIVGDMEVRLMERMTGLEKKQNADHSASVVRLDQLATLIDGIQSVLDQQRGARTLLQWLVGASLIQGIASIVVIWKALTP